MDSMWNGASIAWQGAQSRSKLLMTTDHPCQQDMDAYVLCSCLRNKLRRSQIITWMVNISVREAAWHFYIILTNKSVLVTSLQWKHDVIINDVICKKNENVLVTSCHNRWHLTMKYDVNRNKGYHSRPDKHAFLGYNLLYTPLTVAVTEILYINTENI